jgi:hypothetical protein
MTRIDEQNLGEYFFCGLALAVSQITRRIQHLDVELALAFRQHPFGFFDGIPSHGIPPVEEQDPRPNVDGLLVTPTAQERLALTQQLPNLRLGLGRGGGFFGVC